MDDDDPELVLRRHSIRTLTRAELGLAQGGKGKGADTGRAGPCETGTLKKTGK